jgi:hypothetical protein
MIIKIQNIKYINLSVRLKHIYSINFKLNTIFVFLIYFSTIFKIILLFILHYFIYLSFLFKIKFIYKLNLCIFYRY